MMTNQLLRTFSKSAMLLLFVLGLTSNMAQAQICSAPSNLNSSVLAGNIVSLNWASIPGALNYSVQYRVAGSAAWVGGGTVTTSNQVIANLQPETVYQWRVKANCSPFSSIATYTSGGAVGGNTACSQPSNQVANVISPTSAELSWAGVEGALYYSVQYRIINTAAWTNAGSVSGLTITVNGLTAGAEYQWRVKASCSVYSSIATFSTGSSGTGNSACSQPSNTDASNISTSGATLTWAAILGAFDYTVEYRQGLTGAYINAGTITGTSLTISGLLAGTEYSWRVKASCSDFSSQAVFTTLGTSGNNGNGNGNPSATCSSPSNTNVVAIFATSANIEWEPQGGALNYIVQYRLKNTFTYTTLGTFVGNTASLTGLSPNTEYEWRVKANCSPYGSDVSFTTAAAPMAYRVHVAKNTTIVQQKAMSISPNPAITDEIQISTNIEGAQVEVLSTTGQVLLNQKMNGMQERINVSQLSNGMYIVKMKYQDGKSESLKLMVSH